MIATLVVAYALGVLPSWRIAARWLARDSTYGDAPPDTEARVFGLTLGAIVAMVWPIVVLPPVLWKRLDGARHMANLYALLTGEPPWRCDCDHPPHDHDGDGGRCTRFVRADDRQHTRCPCEGPTT